MYAIMIKGKMISTYIEGDGSTFSPVFSTRKDAVDFINKYNLMNWDDIVKIRITVEKD